MLVPRLALGFSTQSRWQPHDSKGRTQAQGRQERMCWSNRRRSCFLLPLALFQAVPDRRDSDDCASVEESGPIANESDSDFRACPGRSLHRGYTRNTLRSHHDPIRRQSTNIFQPPVETGCQQYLIHQGRSMKRLTVTLRTMIQLSKEWHSNRGPLDPVVRR